MNQASGGDGIPVELFQILDDDAVKVLHSICQQIWKTQQWPQDWKRSVFIPIPKKGNAKECSNYLTIALISHASKVMLKILQARFQQYLNCELPDVQAVFRKDRGIRDQIANICWIIEKAREFKKNGYFCFINYAKAFGERNGNPLQYSCLENPIMSSGSWLNSIHFLVSHFPLLLMFSGSFSKLLAIDSLAWCLLLQNSKVRWILKKSILIITVY